MEVLRFDTLQKFEWKQHFPEKFKLYHLSESNLDGVELELYLQ